MGLSVGEIRQMTVTAVKPYGLWCDCDGQRLLIRIPEVVSDLPTFESCEQVAKVGDVLQAKIIDIFERDGRVDIYGSMRDLGI
jgi:predicted RNA-binding protein with RPS1 domain